MGGQGHCLERPTEEGGKEMELTMKELEEEPQWDKFMDAIRCYGLDRDSPRPPSSYVRS